MTDSGKTTEATPEVEASTAPVETPEGVSGPQDAPDGDPRIAALSAESKKWRTKLRDEQDRTSKLQARVDTHDRAGALRIAAERLTDPEDLFLAHGINDLRDPESGEFSEALTRAALDAVAASHPHWLSPLGRQDQGQGVRRPIKQPQGFGEKLKNMI